MPRNTPASGEHENIPGTGQQLGNTLTFPENVASGAHINILGTHQCLGSVVIPQENWEVPGGPYSRRDSKRCPVIWWLFPPYLLAEPCSVLPGTSLPAESS